MTQNHLFLGHQGTLLYAPRCRHRHLVPKIRAQKNRSPPSNLNSDNAFDNTPHTTDTTPQTQDKNKLVGPFARPAVVVSYARRSVCSVCSGTQSTPCTQCNGTGKLPRGGYNQKRNTLPPTAKVIGSKWTATQKSVFGWRHFQVIERRKQGSDIYVLLKATCDAETQLYININNLRDRDAWAAGWLQKKDLIKLVNNNSNEGLGRSNTDCKMCGGTGNIACYLCRMEDGVVIEL